jgi:large subunit ribosomal protein L29
VKISEIRNLSVEEMKKQLADAEKELLDLKFKLITKQLVNHREVPNTRRKIAQLKTLIREKELAIR